MSSRSFSFFRILILVILILSLVVILAYIPPDRKNLEQGFQVVRAYASFAAFASFDTYLGWLFILRSLAVLSLWLSAFAVWFLYSHRQEPASPAVLLAAVTLALLPLLINPGLGGASPGLPEPWDTPVIAIGLLLAALAIPSLVLLYFIFPRGSYLPGWSRWLAWALTGLYFLAIFVLFLANGSGNSVGSIFPLVLFFCLLTGIIFQVYGFIRQSTTEKRQSSPVFGALLLLPLLFILSDSFSDTSQPFLPLLFQFAMLLALPVGLWIALDALGLWRSLRRPGWQPWRAAGLAGIALLFLLIPAVVTQLNFNQAAPRLAIEPLPVPDQPRPIIIDTDMAPDDWIAILYLLQRPEVDVKAITVTGVGEAHCEPGVRHAAALVALAGESPIPVACGRESPLQGAHAFPDSWREYVDNLAGLSLPAGSNPTPDLSAAELLRQEIAAAPEPLTVLALGPLTNLAEIVQADPSLADRFQVFLMGGALEALGNVGPSEPSIANQVAEWNIYVDPLALKILLDAGVPLTLVPLDATQDAPVTFAFLRLIQSNAFTPEARFVRDLLAAQVGKISDGFYDFWDPLAAAILVDESLAVIRLGDLVVTTQEGPTSGMTRLRSGGVPVRYASGAYGSRFYDDFLQSLNQP